MSWYNPSTWDWGDVKNAGKGAALGSVLGPYGAVAGAIGNAAGGGKITSTIFNDPGADAEKERKRLLYEQAQKAGGFADQGQAGYGQLGTEAAAQRDYLRKLAMGQDSLSAEQLRQGVQQNIAGQISMAAGASPQDTAGAARTAAIQAGRIGAEMSGAAALAGIQERQGANKALVDLIMQQRAQELQAAQGSRGQAIQGYGAGDAGAPEKSNLEKYGPAVRDAFSAVASAAKSDRRVKTDIRDGNTTASEAAKGLRAYTYAYKNPGDGAGPQLGVMAQDLEKVGLRHTVVNTPAGKVLDAGKLSGANTAMIASHAQTLEAMKRRLAELETMKRRRDETDEDQRQLDRSKEKAKRATIYDWPSSNTGTGLEDSGGQ